MTLLLPEYALSEVNHVHCCKAETLLTALARDSVDLIVTSPPYDNLRTYNGFTWDFETIAQQSYRVLKPGGVLVWVVGDETVNGSETLSAMRQAIYFKDVVGFKVHDTMIYEKDGTHPQLPIVRYAQKWEFMFVLSKGVPKTLNIECAPKTGEIYNATRRQRDGSLKAKIVSAGGGPLGNIWRFSTGWMKSTPDAEAYQHPAMFPEKLAERHILSWSNPGDLVLDYFGGSGTTAKMARQNNRNFITCDISAEYCDLMRRRLAMPYTPNMFEVEAVS